ncbi:hypothetical protein XENTR_v10016980 [Xenopus tropicalis]|nr:hypothetical protein XENTR_v10016980 [Xenopus tropicalis]
MNGSRRNELHFYLLKQFNGNITQCFVTHEISSLREANREKIVFNSDNWGSPHIKHFSRIVSIVLRCKLYQIYCNL